MSHKDNYLLKDNYLKVGEIAILAHVLPSTVRYYTKIGLIEADGYTRGRYHLYGKEKTISRIARIKELIGKRYRLDEIKIILDNEKAGQSRNAPDLFDKENLPNA